MTAPLRLATLAATIDVDPYGYIELVMPPEEFVAGWDLDGGAAVLGKTRWGEALVFTGSAEAARAHAAEVIAESTALIGQPVPRVTIPAAAADAVPFLSRGEWSWARIDAPPPVQPREADVTLITDAAVINRFLDEANPDASTRPDDPEVEVWAGIADPAEPGRLLSIAAIVVWQSGGRVLVSVATRPDARGQGLAAAVSAYLTRYAFAHGSRMFALGYYTENTAAEKLYTKLGFTTYARNVSGWLVERPSE